MLRNSRVRVSSRATVFAASTLEYMLAELAEVAVKVASDNKRKRVSMSDVSTALRTDQELDFVCAGLSFGTSVCLDRAAPGELGSLFV